MKNYLKMLRYRRPAGSDTEKAFIDRFIRPLGVEEDEAGNLIKRIGDVPVLWSCHTDTVHREEGFQKVACFKGGTVALAKGEKSNCLGADCTTGVWIMTEMIKAKVPGLYIFHRAEERGGIGSTWIAEKTPELLTGIKYAIAFDRFGTTSVITHQFGRCCSDKFAISLAAQLPGYGLDSGGIFTDTACYTELVPECTNLSVGYFGHHSANESQDVGHMMWLLKRMKNLKIEKLVVDRDPTEKKSYSSYYSSPSYGAYFDDDERFFTSSAFRSSKKDPSSFVKLVLENAEGVVDLLEQYGLTEQDVEAYVYGV